MKKIIYSLLFLFIFSTIAYSQNNNNVSEVDICVYGGTSAGVIAAYTAKKMGKSVILIESGQHLGGMTSGGLGYTDIGNKYVVTGLAHDFYRKVGAHYGRLESWIFEPRVAEKIFNDYIERGNIDVIFGKRLKSVHKADNKITKINIEDSKFPNRNTNKIIKAKIYIDCSYEGDLMAKANVSYTIGREDNKIYHETHNGVQLQNGHQLPDSIDPYIIKGNKKSGVLWGVSTKPIKPTGSGDKKVQAYNYRITLTNNKQNFIPITRPENYDSTKYELLIRINEKKPWESLHDIFIISMLPNAKTDINNKNGFSTDMIGNSWRYPNANYKERSKIWKQHEDYTKGLLYFIGHDKRIPLKIRNEMLSWGYPKDEYIDNNHWSHQLYVREARRMIGELVMTQHHCQGKEICDDEIGWAAYTMDSHNCDRQIINGYVRNEGNVEVGGFPPYPISYRAIVPQKKEITNLLVPVCLSASHIAYGSIRMEPIFMVLSQSAATAACLAINNNVPVQDINVLDIQRIIKSNPLIDDSVQEILIDNDNKKHVIISGDWKIGNIHSFGANFLIDESKGDVFKSVKYLPQIDSTSNYSIYIYYPKLKNTSSQIVINICTGNFIIEKTINKDNVAIEGQASGEWIYLGRYKIDKNESVYVEITNKKADNIVIADAVLFIPEQLK